MLFDSLLLGVSGGIDLVKNSTDLSKDISHGWDQLWKDYITNSDSPGSSTHPYYFQQVVWVATIIAVPGIIAFFFNFILRFFMAGGAAAASHGIAYSLVLGLMMFALSNHAAPLGKFSYDLNKLILIFNDHIMTFRTADVTLSDSVNTFKVTEDAKTRVMDKYNECMNSSLDSSGTTSQQSQQSSSVDSSLQGGIERSQRAICLALLKQQVNQWRQDYQTKYCNGIINSCNGAVQYLTYVGQGISDAWNNAQFRYDARQQSTPNQKDPSALTLLSSEIGSAIRNAAGGLYMKTDLFLDQYSSQFGFMHGLVGGLFLLGMFSPVFVSGSLYPISPRPFWTWLILFLHIGLIICLYNVLIGVAATALIKAKADTVTDLQYAYFLGRFAPAIASGIGFFSGWKALSAAQQNAQAIAGAAISVATTIITTAISFLV
jgi:hypothetical protein